MSKFILISASAVLIILIMAGCSQQHKLIVGDDSLVSGKVVHRTLKTDSEQEYYLYIPKTIESDTQIFVSVHGISRNALEHADLFSPYAERYGVVLIAPVFPASKFHGYQRLYTEIADKRADLVLDRIVDEVRRETGIRSEKLFLFGYSGGGQFVHRYTMAHAQRVAKVVIGAAGWYTFPDSAETFPQGIRPNPNIPGITPDPDQFLRVPAYVLVGERDVGEQSLNETEQIETEEGNTRLERGRRWVGAMRTAAKARGFDTDYGYFTLPRSRHSFHQCMRKGGMGTLTFRLLFGDPIKPSADKEQ